MVPREMLRHILTITSMTCFVFGAITNCFLLYRVIVSILISRASKRYGFTNVRELPHSNSTRVYIMLISIIDLIGLMIIPITLVKSKYGHILSELSCQLIYAIDWTSKLFVAMLLTALTIHRYTGICVSQKAKSAVATIFRTLLIVWTALIISTTVPIFALSKHIINPDANYSNYDVSSTNQSKVTTCKLQILNKEWDIAIQIVAVSLSCVIPATLIAVFSHLLLHFLKAKQMVAQNTFTAETEQPSSTGQRLNLASKNLLKIIFWYFTCFVPYWSLAVVASNFIPAERTIYTTIMSVLCYFGNLGPYIHSSINPFLCLRMNTNLWYTASRQSQRSATRRRQSQFVYQGSELGRTRCQESNHENSNRGSTSNCGTRV